MTALNSTLILTLILGLTQAGMAGSPQVSSSMSRAFAMVEGGNDAPEGSFRVRLLESISTDSSKPGDTVKARILAPEVLKGDILEGKIHYCKKGGKLKGDAVLAFSFNRLNHGGKVIPIKSWVRSIASNDTIDLNGEGILSQRNENLDNAGVFALNGAAWGAFDGDFKVAGMGAGVSAGTYLAWSWLTGKKPSISLPQGTEIWIDMEDLQAAPEVSL